MVRASLAGLDLVAQSSSKGMLAVSPASVHGMLWLQTHFSKDSWEPLALGQAVFSQDCADELLIDARSAGLNIDATAIHS